MRPHVICHMVSSIDGRIIPRHWRPAGLDLHALYERLHRQLGGDAWLVGRVTGQELAKAEAYSRQSDQTFPRTPWFAQGDASGYGVVLDPQGKIAWGRGDIDGDQIVVVLTEQVPDAHLAGLRRDGVSYIFAGKAALDLPLALEILHRELGVQRLLLEGGGRVNGSFLRAGLIDEISLIVAPAIDGATGVPSVFDSSEQDAGAPSPVKAMRLEQSEPLDGGAVWLRYRLESNPA